jgi:cytochrome oxidase assembly protein ShyY1
VKEDSAKRTILINRGWVPQQQLEAGELYEETADMTVNVLIEGNTIVTLL